MNNLNATATPARITKRTIVLSLVVIALTLAIGIATTLKARSASLDFGAPNPASVTVNHGATPQAR